MLTAKEGASQLGTSSKPGHTMCWARGLRGDPGRVSDERRLLGREAEDHLGIRRASKGERKVRRGKTKSGNKPPCEEEVEEEEKLLHGQGGRWATARMLCAAHSELGGTRSPACGESEGLGWVEGSLLCISCAIFSVSPGSRTGF